MPKEKKYQLKLLAGSVCVILCSGMYAWGGMEMKWLRRFVAPTICAVFISIVNREPLQLIKAPLLGISSSLGYGADLFWTKILKRFYVGAAFTLAATSDHIIKRRWIPIIFSFLSIVGVFILYGVFNPVHARAEETFISMIIYTNAIIPSIKEE